MERTAMDFAFSEDQLAIKDSVARLCAQFDDKYWLKKDKEGGFPSDFYKAMADAGADVMLVEWSTDANVASGIEARPGISDLLLGKAKFEDVARPDFIAQSHRRYELHRVWVVEATVKAGMRHSAPKRTVYLDEDSWAPVLMDDFDGQGKLAKMREGFLIPVYETGTCDVMAMVQNNVAEGRYVFDTHTVGVGKDIRWVTEASGARFKAGFYTADNLRAISER